MALGHAAIERQVTMSNRKATAATVAPAAAIVPLTGGHVAVSNIAFDAKAHKYASAPQAIPCAGKRFRLTALGNARPVTGKSGKPDVAGIVTAAAKLAGATADNAVDGAAIVLAMQGNAELLAMLGRTKATRYAPNGKVPCAAWASGWVSGCARASLALLARD